MPPLPFTCAFRPREKPGRGFVRLLRAISNRARGLTRHSRGPVTESIHEVRLLIKRTRAMLWFARPVLDDAAYAQAKARLREAAGLLAAERDLAVTQSTLEDLAQKASKRRDRAAVAEIFQSLVRGPSAGTTPEKSLRTMFRKAVGILCDSVDEMRGSVAVDAAWPLPCERLKKAFRTTRKAGKKARKTEKDADFHAWRKKAKRLLYHLELTQAESGRRMKHTLNCVARLQDKLGKYHDCVVVEDHLRRMLPLPPAARRVADLLEKRKTSLRKKACKIARRLKDSA